MSYDFETLVDRSAHGSKKWLQMREACPAVSPDVVPMSTADMEFLNAPEIKEGLKTYIDTVIQGYTVPTQSYFDAVLRWQKERHGVEAKQEWIVTTSGVIQAIHLLIGILTEPGDGVIIQQPVYYPFSMLVKISGRRLVNNALIERENTYEMDFDDLEKKAKDPRNKVLVLCNPHNPVGKVWSREDLQRLMDICIANGVFVIDDEIHNDLILPGYRHTALPALSPEAALHCAYCTAPSKTFNLAGMQLSNIFIADPKLRGKLALAKMQGMNLDQVAISYEACRLAYDQAGPWLDALLPVVAGNARYVQEFLAEHIPQAHCYPLEGTYLLWVDFRKLGMTHKELAQLMREAQLFLDEGAMFGTAGRGFMRFNLALPRKPLEAAMHRLLAAWQNRQAAWACSGRPEHITLEPGMAMPDFTYDTPFASGLDFSAATAGTPTVLLFHRYISCSLCNMALRQLAGGYDAIQAAGGQLMVVMQSQPERVWQEMGGQNAFPFDIICDPERRLYDRFNIFTADSQMDLLGDNFQVIGAMLEQMTSGQAAAVPEGASDQMPAYIVLDAAGKITHIHYGESIFDTPRAEELAALLNR